MYVFLLVLKKKVSKTDYGGVVLNCFVVKISSAYCMVVFLFA